MSFLAELKKQKNKLKETDTVITKADGKKLLESKNCVTELESNSYGFVVDTKPDNIPALITEHLYIGSQDCTATNILEEYNIIHVLSLGIKVENTKKYVECLDLPETDIKPILCECLPFINKGICSKENVLVHCNAGVSRTSMVAIAYLMQYENMEYNEAYNLVKNKRPAIRPNDGFQKQLKLMKPGQIL